MEGQVVGLWSPDPCGECGAAAKDQIWGRWQVPRASLSKVDTQAGLSAMRSATLFRLYVVEFLAVMCMIPQIVIMSMYCCRVTSIINYTFTSVSFQCEGITLLGRLHLPSSSIAPVHRHGLCHPGFGLPGGIACHSWLRA